MSEVKSAEEINMHYKYCPECGKKLVDRQAGDDGLVPYCENCKEYRFDTFPCCSIVMVYNEYNEIVLCKQSYLSEKYMSFTAGFITPGETAEECALREISEELGLEGENLEYVGTYWFSPKGLLMHGFTAFSPKREFKLSSEIDYAQWVPILEARGKMYPPSPGNAASAIYEYFIKSRGLGGR